MGIVGNCWELSEIVGNCRKLLGIVRHCWELSEIVGIYRLTELSAADKLQGLGSIRTYKQVALGQKQLPCINTTGLIGRHVVRAKVFTWS